MINIVLQALLLFYVKKIDDSIITDRKQTYFYNMVELLKNPIICEYTHKLTVNSMQVKLFDYRVVKTDYSVLKTNMQ